MRSELSRELYTYSAEKRHTKKKPSGCMGFYKKLQLKSFTAAALKFFFYFLNILN